MVPTVQATLAEVCAHTVLPSAPAYAQARALQRLCFARACAGAPDAYLATVDTVPERTIPIVVQRTTADGLLLGTLRLELAGASIVEAIVRFGPGTEAQQHLTRGQFAELGGFATRPKLDHVELLDVIDAMALAATAAARAVGISWFCLFPRLPLMSLFLAPVAGMLPPYRFTRCADVQGWHEGHPRLAAVRRLGVKGLETRPDRLPVVYAIPVAQMAQDVQDRLASWSQRRQCPDLGARWRAAMRQSYQQLRRELEQANAVHARSA